MRQTVDACDTLPLTSIRLAGAADADQSDVLQIASVKAATHGTVALNAAGDIVFTPTASYTGAAAFTYTISDGHGGLSTAATNLTVDLHQVFGTPGSDTLHGTATPSALLGLAGNDTITAGSAGDFIDGGSGNDALYGGAGIDTFAFQANFGMDTIYNFTTAGARHDILQFNPALFSSPQSVLTAAHQVGHDVVITATSQDQVTLANTSLAALTLTDIKIG